MFYVIGHSRPEPSEYISNAVEEWKTCRAVQGDTALTVRRSEILVSNVKVILIDMKNTDYRGSVVFFLFCGAAMLMIGELATMSVITFCS